MAGGSTSLHNAIYVSLKELGKIKALNEEDVRRQALVVFSDGEDTSSLVSFDEVLDLAKVEAGKDNLQEEVFAIDEPIDQSMRMVREAASGRAVVLELDIAGVLPALRADKRRIQQVMLNLLSNAVKFTNPGGQIWVRVARRDNGDLEVVVADNGIGMAPEDIPKALAPFERILDRLVPDAEAPPLRLPELHSNGTDAAPSQ